MRADQLVFDRLGRDLALEGMDRKIQEIAMQDSRGCVKKDTHTRLRALRIRLWRMFPSKRSFFGASIVVDPTDVCKENARKMQYLYKVRDGSRSKEKRRALARQRVRGLHGDCLQQRKQAHHTAAFSLWSTIAPDYHSENAEIVRILDQIGSVHGKKGPWWTTAMRSRSTANSTTRPRTSGRRRPKEVCASSVNHLATECANGTRVWICRHVDGTLSLVLNKPEKGTTPKVVFTNNPRVDRG